MRDDIDKNEPASEADPSEKLQKVLARAGLGSRRELERDIAAGLVKVNGSVAKLGDRVVADDRIEFDGKPVRLAEADDVRVLLYNKPEGEICTRSDPEGRRTVFESLPSPRTGRWVQVGRLDLNTSGLMLFTNHGELANKLMHPSTGIDREYLVRVRNPVPDAALENMVAGVELEDGVAKFTDIAESPNNDENKNYSWYYCVVMEGRNREVRRLWESQDIQISRLKRVRYGNIFIPSHVRVGQWIELGFKEIVDLFETAGLAPPKRKAYQQKLDDQRRRHEKKLRSTNARKRR
jgi:23S rRNA pseudouridine2605 synthase